VSSHLVDDDNVRTIVPLRRELWALKDTDREAFRAQVKDYLQWFPHLEPVTLANGCVICKSRKKG
jgi:hypothetical protein